MFSNTGRTNFGCCEYLHKIREKFYRKRIEKLVTRCNKCLDRHGDYVEKIVYTLNYVTELIFGMF